MVLAAAGVEAAVAAGMPAATAPHSRFPSRPIPSAYSQRRPSQRSVAREGGSHPKLSPPFD